MSFYLPFHHKNLSQQSLCMYFNVFLPIKMQKVKLFFIAFFMVFWRKNTFDFMGSSTLCFKILGTQYRCLCMYRFGQSWYSNELRYPHAVSEIY